MTFRFIPLSVRAGLMKPDRSTIKCSICFTIFHLPLIVLLFAILQFIVRMHDDNSNTSNSNITCVNLLVYRCIHGVALRRKSQGSSTSRICPPPRPPPHQPFPPPPAPPTPTSGRLHPPSLHHLPPHHRRRHISATLTSWVRTFTLYNFNIVEPVRKPPRGILIIFLIIVFVWLAAAYYPGKCMAHTSSTYTFTTCRILHPTDELTRVTPRLATWSHPILLNNSWS